MKTGGSQECPAAPSQPAISSNSLLTLCSAISIALSARLKSSHRPDTACDNDLELYALDRMDEAAAPPVDEHLLVCEKCLARLAGWDAYVGAMREAN